MKSIHMIVLLFVTLQVMAQCDNDQQNPSMTCPLHIFVGGRYISYADIDSPFISDNCDSNLTATMTWSEGFYDVGLHWMMWATSDLSGNGSTCYGYVRIHECPSPTIIDSSRNGDYLTMWWTNVARELYKVYIGRKFYVTKDTFITVETDGGNLDVLSDCENNCCR